MGGCIWLVCRDGGAEAMGGRLFGGFQQARTLSKSHRPAQYSQSLDPKDLVWSWAARTQAEGS